MFRFRFQGLIPSPREGFACLRSGALAVPSWRHDRSEGIGPRAVRQMTPNARIIVIPPAKKFELVTKVGTAALSRPRYLQDAADA
jgi:hypothetical protein